MLHSDDSKINYEKLHGLVSKLTILKVNLEVRGLKGNMGKQRSCRTDVRKEVMLRLMHQNTNVTFVRKLLVYT